MTVATQAPLLIGLVLKGVEVIVKTAAVLKTPPSFLVIKGLRLKVCDIVLKRLRFPLVPKGLCGFSYQDCNSSER